MKAIVVAASVTPSWCFPDEQTALSIARSRARLRVAGASLGTVQTISRDRRMTPYDALYLELPLRMQSPLVSLDRPNWKPRAYRGIARIDRRAIAPLRLTHVPVTRDIVDAQA